MVYTCLSARDLFMAVPLKLRILRSHKTLAIGLRHNFWTSASLCAERLGRNDEEQIQEFNETMEDLFGTVGNQALAQRTTVPHEKHEATPAEEEAESLSHIDHQGKAAMVDVGHKSETARHAVASGRVVLGHEAFQAVETNRLAKGDVLSVARVAGIMAAKQTASLIPLCHPLPLNRIGVDFEMRPELHAIDILGEVRCGGKTGVEMEALTAVSVAALTIYDMCKAVTKDIRIHNIQLDEKVGGKSGIWRRQVNQNDCSDA